MNSKQLDIGVYISALLVAVSVALPITTLPVIGEVSYYTIAKNESYIIVALCLITPALIFMDKSKLVILPPIGVWLTLLFPAVEQMLKTKPPAYCPGRRKPR